jgi:3,4-dihydroxy-2-butanone 4-phosphate synthase
MRTASTFVIAKVAHEREFMASIPATAVDEIVRFVTTGADRIATAVSALASGVPTVLCDGDECSLVIPCYVASAPGIALMVREGSGLVFAALPAQRLSELGVPRMSTEGEQRCGRLHVAVDASEDIGTGISARDRAKTFRLLGDPMSQPADFVRPGHVIPVAADMRHNQTATAAHLALALVSLVRPEYPSAAFCALTSVTDPSSIAGSDEGRQIAEDRNHPFVTREDVLTAFYRQCDYWPAIESRTSSSRNESTTR